MDRQQSEFNMAVAYLGRLNALFYAADEAAMELDLYTWQHSLWVIFRELSTEMKEEEIVNFSKDIKDCANAVNQSISKNARSGKKEVSPELYEKLHNLEMQLRKVMKSSGLQMRMSEEAGRALR